MKLGKFRLLSLYLSTGLVILAVFFIISAGRADALTSTSILVDIVPPSPAPFEDTTIALSSYADNLDSVLITWTVNGKNVLSGIGKKSYTLKAPSAGSETAVLATIALPSGSVQTRMVIRPSVMVLLWQANDSYVPPFYRGKALPTPDSEIKVVAMPEVRTGSGVIASKNMTYAWKKDYTNLPDDSGYGKNSFVYTNDYLDDSSNISVVASTVNQGNSVESNIDVGTVQPKIIFYKEDNILGTVWQQALSDPHIMQGPEIVKAIPYFISPKDLQSPILSWSWSINGNSISTQSLRKNVLPLTTENGVSGTSRLKLQIDNRFKIFQTTSKEININF